MTTYRHPGCGVRRLFLENDHECTCEYAFCTGFTHLCSCGQYWPSTVRTRFISFDQRGRRAGDPCGTRMAVISQQGPWPWRVFELAQMDQRVSRHTDWSFKDWQAAWNYARTCIAQDAQAQREYLIRRAEGITP